MLSLIYVAVICVLTFLFYRKLWQAMEQPQTQARQLKIFQFIEENETESEEISPEHALLAQDEKEEEESIFYL